MTRHHSKVHLIPGKKRVDHGGRTAASLRARFQVVFVAWSWFRQNGVILSRYASAIPRRSITHTLKQPKPSNRMLGFEYLSGTLHSTRG
jgi:hypothetical protein